jgi:tetratricopeptide (TPR) repeat protein
LSLWIPAGITAAVLLAFGAIIGRQNRDLLRAQAYGEFAARLVPLAIAGILVLWLPVIVNMARPDRAVPVMLVYMAMTVILVSLAARSVAAEERKAGNAYRKGDYERAVEIYRELVQRKPLPRHYCALGASLDATGDHLGAVEATSQAIKQDPEFGLAYYNRASSRAALGQRNPAMEDLRAVLRADSSRKLKQAALRALESLEKNEPLDGST